MLNKMTVLDLSDGQLRGKRALVRVDYNVPLDEDNAVADDARIRATLPTVEYLRGRGARIVLMSHLGRPKGKPNAALSLASVAECLRELLDRRVAFAPHPVSDETIAASHDLEPGGVLLLENTRFHPGETANDPAFAQSLAALGDVYVNDAFGTAHRAHASTTGVAQHLRPAVVGLLMERELTHLGKLLENPERPFIAVLGGGKVSGKIELIENLLSKVDRLCVGGAMSGTFFKAMGLEVGQSIVEPELLDFAREQIDRAGPTLVLPSDVVVTRVLEPDADTVVVNREAIPTDCMVADIGNKSAAAFAKIIQGARTVLWNGPVGVFELEPFAAGTRAVGRAVAEATERGATSVVGGGDTAAAIAGLGLTGRMTHVSTGGGATLEFLAGKELPAVAALTDRQVGQVGQGREGGEAA